MFKPWLSHYDVGVPESLSYPVLPIDHLLVHRAHQYPKQTAVIFASADGRSLAAAKYSYKEINTAVYQFATGLQQLGIRKGDRVAIMLPNSPQFIIAINAVWRLGGIAVCAESRYATRYLEKILYDSGSETIITTEKVQQRLEKNWDKLPLNRVVVTDIESYLPWQTKRVTLSTSPLTQIFRPSENVPGIQFNKALSKDISKLKLIEVSLIDTAVILYSHFRVQKLVGVQLTHRNLMSNAMAVNAWCHIGKTQDRRLAVVPFSHAFGLTLALNAGIIAGDTLVILHNLLRPEQIMQAIQQYHINILPATPAMLTHLAAQSSSQGETLASLQKIISSSALPPAAYNQLDTALPGVQIVETFGQPETSAVVTMNPLSRHKAETIGIPVPDTNIMIADSELGTNELPPGETGEIIVKGPQIMQSYWQQSGTAAQYVRVGPDGQHGWYFTGHFGYMDEDGFLYLSE